MVSAISALNNYFVPAFYMPIKIMPYHDGLFQEPDVLKELYQILRT